ncbi:LuxR C-terminal-related transcriptional regulator [Gaetbulibacter sp. M240]|uniref:LuxR family transcriptional regulator n=1 Tax=Gaetbulibacter sp. M240 TaxID=3126511 RepID=UPI00374E935E
MRYCRTLIYILFFSIFFSAAQELPPIAIYESKVYNAENQNWSISQSKDHYIYVANNSGLLEFNGSRWKLFPSPSGIMRSVHVIDNLIYTGSYREFGFWKENSFGILEYHSISDELDIEFFEDEEFWNIIAVDEYILFQSFKSIFIYNKKNNTYSRITSEGIIYKVFKLEDDIYFQEEKTGLYMIDNGESKLVSDDLVIKENLLVNIYKEKDTILIETENNGFYTFKEGALNKWQVPANKVLTEVSVYRSAKLRDGSYILGTRSNGIILLSPSGEIIKQIDTETGLSNNTIHYIFEDDKENIWLALDNGINCINMTSPFSLFTENEGKLGTVYASLIYENTLYLGTNQGLFYKPLDSKSTVFNLIKNTQGPVWNLRLIDDTLWCCHDSGTFIIKNNKATLALEARGAWDIKPIPDHPKLFLQGNYSGLYIIEADNQGWHIRNKIENFDISSRFFEIQDNTIFVSHENKGVFRIKVNPELTKAQETEIDTTVGKSLKSCVVKYNGSIFYSTASGVYRFNNQDNKFEKDSILSKLYTKDSYLSGKMILDKTQDMLWNFSKDNLNYITTGKFAKTPEINRIPISRTLSKGLTGYENIAWLKDDQYLIGTSSGYVVLDMNKLKKKDYKININTIQTHSIADSTSLVELGSNKTFEYKYNNITFEYNVPEFDKYLDVYYQYKLDGLYSSWSEWSDTPINAFQNLPFGDYTFSVRAKVGNTLSQNTASYTFAIDRPWYLSQTMIIAYVLFVIIFSIIMHNIYKHYYKQQRERLLEKTTRELELKELENKQQLMRFNNEKLRQDIENKNRELGISTMSLIKKNEFLNNIKKELEGIDNVTQLKKINKIIDRNLSDNDDWKLFEEAFNNADKDFLKKIKSSHPELTSNDLRLCAYLRLNLSSKEIAPLLNISPRSVEVKRYRLRKKLNLEHNDSLSDYILEI